MNTSTAVVLLVLFLCLGSDRADDEFRCYSCSSDTDPKCISDPTGVTNTTCEESCFAKVDPTTGHVSRGCKTEDVTCDGDTCGMCQESLCNNYTICKKCDSALDPDCAQTTANLDKFNALCAAGQTKCLSKVRDDKHTERRCATANDEKACTGSCQVCEVPNCNVGFFPASRLHCYQCNSTDSKCGDVATNSNAIVSLPCLLYEADDVCYTFGTSATAMTRGCVSDPDTTVNKCSTPASNEACAVCATDNCNNPTYELDQALKCIQCADTDSTANATCQWGHDASEAKDCQNKIVYHQKGGCYWETTDDRLVRRGCLYDRTAEQGACSADASCWTCDSGNGCNNADVDVFSCIRCRSDIDAHCHDPASNKLEGTQCRNTVTLETSGCFTGTWNGVVIRGCMVDADPRQKVVCEDENDSQCTTCNTRDCNNVKEGAAGLRLASGLLVLAALCLWRLR